MYLHCATLTIVIGIFYIAVANKSLKIGLLVLLFLLSLFWRKTISTTSEKDSAQRRNWVTILLIMAILNVCWIMKTNISEIDEIKSSKFDRQVVQAFKRLPQLDGNVWTNINAPLLFRYTGGNVFGYCTERGIRNLDRESCFSGGKFKNADRHASNIIVLSEVYPSGDIACFKPNPCFERLLNDLAKNYDENILSFYFHNEKHSFHIFRERE